MTSLQHSPSGPSSNDELSFRDLWQMLCEAWRLVLVGLTAGLVIAGGYLAMTPNQYEAAMLIKLGQVGAVDSVRQIEASRDVVERLQSPAFEMAVLESLGWNGDARGDLYKSSLRATTPRDKYIEVRLRGLTPNDARRAAEGTFIMLEGAHRSLIKKVVAKNEQQLAATVAEIADTEALLRRLERLLGKAAPQSDLQGVLMWLQIREWLQITQNQKDHLRNLRLQEKAVREALNPELTASTAVIEPVMVSGSPVYPKARQAWILAGIGGLLLGVLLVALRSLVGMKQVSGLMDTDRQTCTPSSE